MYMLYGAIDEFDFEKIENANLSKEAWDILEKISKGDNPVKQVRLQTLKGELESMRIKEAERATKYVSRV